MSQQQALVFNNAQMTRERLKATFQLVAGFDGIARDKLKELLEPTGKQAASNACINFLASLQLIDDRNGLYYANPEVTNFDDALSAQLLDQTRQNQPQYLLSLFAAYYATQNEQVMFRSRNELIQDFNRDILRDKSRSGGETTMNDEKFRGWIRWAIHLGWGRLHPKGNMLTPDATQRLQKVLDDVIAPNEHITIQAFLDKLSVACPELDNGALYNYCQQSLGNDTIMPTAKLSLMLSTALYTLQHQSILKLHIVNDAVHKVTIFGEIPVQTISHIERVSA
jgi:hypothetical protein